MYRSSGFFCGPPGAAHASGGAAAVGPFDSASEAEDDNVDENALLPLCDFLSLTSIRLGEEIDSGFSMIEKVIPCTGKWGRRKELSCLWKRFLGTATVRFGFAS
ncbi:uncharacterized protein HKW66_Vig0180700 [Vigna angularis]|uniref:Uncharacterized protein n=1 Tax=Phaseolus angularis TaxID=3914 RepID=A0A8T0K728_PHAAN|nr:uncharacterized protein HKW66_Vig0180700 [Vigna angularis]